MIAWKSIGSFAFCLIVLLISTTIHSCNEPKQNLEYKSELPEVKSAPVFTAENSDGTTFNSSSLKGNVWVASFMFTSCSGVCPVMNGRQSTLQQEYSKSNVKFVSISVDPETDTKEVLDDYAKEYNANPYSWFFVRMPLDSVRGLAVKGFMVSDPVEPSAHSPRFILVDKKGMIRGYYDSMDSVKVQELRNSISSLLKEK
ncbi:MAG: SCO family protein [Candidatus Kapaibacterium sp.]